MTSSSPSGAPTNVPREVYEPLRLVLYTVGAVLLGVLIAGFWNYHLVDGFGQHMVAGQTIGDTAELANSYPSRGSSFGFLFAAVAGLAATFTACNCVVFAMIPGLACSTDADGSEVRPMRAFWTFVGGVLIVCAAYGAVIGVLGSQGVEMLNARSVRLGQAQIVFSLLGAAMLGWSVFELGFLRSLTDRLSDSVRSFFASATTKAGLLGVMVGLFAVGRPFPVFRQFLSYAATAENPIYGAGVMMVQGAGQILVMALLFLALIWGAGEWLGRWASEKPHQPRLVSGLALLTGGTFFVYYWGLAFVFDIGRWGFKLGLYG